MTAHIRNDPATRRAESGWARARRLRRAGAAPRTCLAAVAAPGAAAGMQSGPEWNIVRGED
ncbi:MULTISPECIES: hypothetical protein [unclassified Streptomyces]|uniref:hypothetical protein n=1 Tax=unclassified Streptomyces TaxID=2593676 RepID=UPI00070BB6A2|nr:hypothetical protein [Streptomyces sp. Root1310]KQX67528.1 hypothetical protein ASD48_15785 [Streptomyces sp. Root1310]